MPSRTLPDYTCANPECGTTFRPWNRKSKFCSRPCSAAWKRQQVWWVEARRKAGRVTQAKNRRQRLEKVRDKVIGLSPAQAYWLGRTEGYPQAWKVGHRVGYAKGYEAGVRDK